MATKCIYPFPSLVTSTAATRRNWATWEIEPVKARLSFWQPDGKAWDWARARRLADAVYPGNKGIVIEHRGVIFAEGDTVAPVKRTMPAKLLAAMVRDYLAGNIDRDALVEAVAA